MISLSIFPIYLLLFRSSPISFQVSSRSSREQGEVCSLPSPSLGAPHPHSVHVENEWSYSRGVEDAN
jgi:hypothetical protein